MLLQWLYNSGPERLLLILFIMQEQDQDQRIADTDQTEGEKGLFPTIPTGHGSAETTQGLS